MSDEKPTWWRRFRAGWANAFAPGPHGPLTGEDRALLDKIADAHEAMESGKTMGKLLVDVAAL